MRTKCVLFDVGRALEGVGVARDSEDIASLLAVQRLCRSVDVVLLIDVPPIRAFAGVGTLVELTGSVRGKLEQLRREALFEAYRRLDLFKQVEAIGHIAEEDEARVGWDRCRAGAARRVGLRAKARSELSVSRALSDARAHTERCWHCRVGPPEGKAGSAERVTVVVSLLDHDVRV